MDAIEVSMMHTCGYFLLCSQMLKDIFDLQDSTYLIYKTLQEAKPPAAETSRALQQTGLMQGPPTGNGSSLQPSHVAPWLEDAPPLPAPQPSAPPGPNTMRLLEQQHKEFYQRRRMKGGQIKQSAGPQHQREQQHKGVSPSCAAAEAQSTELTVAGMVPLVLLGADVPPGVTSTVCPANTANMPNPQRRGSVSSNKCLSTAMQQSDAQPQTQGGVRGAALRRPHSLHGFTYCEARCNKGPHPSQEVNQLLMGAPACPLFLQAAKKRAREKENAVRKAMMPHSQAACTDTRSSSQPHCWAASSITSPPLPPMQWHSDFQLQDSIQNATFWAALGNCGDGHLFV